MNEKFCYGCMKPFHGESCSCGWHYDYVDEDAENLLIPGTLLNGGSYMVGRRLGRGGFGITYIGQQQSELRLKVAVKEYYPKKLACRNVKYAKELSPAYREGMTQFDRQNLEHRYEQGKRGFIEEAKRLAELNELATIVSVLGYFEENNTAYIIMEYIDGIDLYQYIQKNNRTMCLREMEEYIYPIIRDLEQVHQKGIIHRDISPDNIMLTKSGNVKVIDFGASVSMDGEEDVKILRKNGFAPLEQYEKDASLLGAWTDVYAMCATIYYLLSGKMIPDARDRQFFDRYEQLRDRNILIPKRFDRVLKKGLAVDSSKRYRSMNELLRQLKKIHAKSTVGSWVCAGVLLGTVSLGVLLGYHQFLTGSTNSIQLKYEGYTGRTRLEELAERWTEEQADSASDYAVYGDLVYIRYTFADGIVMLVRSPIGTDDLNSVEYVTDGAFDRFCVDGDWLYFTLEEDQCLYRMNIGDIGEIPDAQQRIEVWRAEGRLERVSSRAPATEYGFSVAGGYVYSVVRAEKGNAYEILRATADGTESLVTNLNINITNCIFYGGYIFMTAKEKEDTVLYRMRMDGCFFEELARYSGDIPAMRIVEGTIYYLYNSADGQSGGWLGKMSTDGRRDEILSVMEDAGVEYCYMTGVVDGANIYYTCSVEGMEAINSLYCYSLETGINKQISSECGRYIVTSDEIDVIIFASMDGSEIRQMNKDGSNPHIMRGENGGTGISEYVDVKSLAIIRDHVYYLDGGSVAYKKIGE